MFTNFYIARPTYCFILMCVCSLTVVIKEICCVIIANEGMHHVEY